MYVCSANVVKVDRHYDKSSSALAVEALAPVVEACGEPDALVVSTYLSRYQESFGNLGALLAEYLGFKGEVYEVSAGEASGGAAVALAYKLVRSGLKRVLVVGVDKTNDFQSKKAVKHLQTLLSPYESFYGLTYAGAHALAASLYMKEFNVSREELAHWAVVMHDNATAVPHAQLRFPVTVEKVLNSNSVAEPLKLLDSHPFSDGAAAVMLTSETSPVALEVAAASSKLTLAERDLTFMESAKAAMEALGNPEPEAVEVHDPFSVAGVIALESLGLAPRGKGIKYLLENAHSVNPSGGLKARGHPVGATGVYQVAEGFLAITSGLGKLGKVSSFLAHSSNLMGATTYLTYMREV
ncbi:thiolase C-terminal domain-containing protein [Ignicoccus hospitalis]|uniref:Acetyl-CoA acetyltransferase-like protein n=1 Tax=Ignicoccus hospitalis (strain KIN4/I / DSM 18386 / JCM 14125) TaxID=453591 RepID=A8A9F8_IGNH4|nr:acetyl-CoA acetyltransferase [Ignicoccus hospitalis]ABU81560.1 Acetyl-CoA acetyltransferase-like protein [Ignicoccus hospitalis KIN4/I]HIH90495.1 acetyl-CoA acetyltransferase [Desulfurococcaceae archaeon]